MARVIKNTSQVPDEDRHAMAEYLKSQAADLPEECGLYSILRDHRRGLLTKAEDFFYRYPSQTMLGAYTLGAASMLQSGRAVATAVTIGKVMTKAGAEPGRLRQTFAIVRALPCFR